MKTYPYLNIRGTVAFPETEIFLMIGRERSMRAIDQALAGDQRLVLIAQKESENNTPSSIEDMYRIGAVAHIEKAIRLDDTRKIYCKTESRIAIESLDIDGEVPSVVGTVIDGYSGEPQFTKESLQGIHDKVKNWSQLYAKKNGEFERLFAKTKPAEIVRICRHYIRYFEILPELSDKELIKAAKEGLGKYYQQCFDGKRSVINQMVADRQQIMEESNLERQMHLLTQLLDNEINLHQQLQSSP